jgi:hypothetical protein
MEPTRRLRVLSDEELRHLTEARLLAYRKTALSLEDSLEESDYSVDDLQGLDPSLIYFKSDVRWKAAYDRILQALANVQSRA